MQVPDKAKKNKGGRPAVPDPKKGFIGVHCTKEQKKIIEQRAAAVNMAVSEFLRELGLNGMVSTNTIDKSVLQELGNLSHIRSCLNQLAKKKNQGRDFDLYERTVLLDTADELLKAARAVSDKLKQKTS